METKSHFPKKMSWVRKVNFLEFVTLYVDFIINKRIEAEFRSFKDGFFAVCQNSSIDLFDPEELILLICGESHLDFDELERNTTYDGYTKDSTVVLNFWQIFRNFDHEKKKKMLFFVTGSSRAPIEGLSKLPFVIAKNGPDSDRIPTAHTCFNILLLPEYSTKEKLQKYLEIALAYEEGFGLI